MDESLRRSLRMAVRHFYDVQIIRQQHSGRIAKIETLLNEDDKAHFVIEVKRLKTEEKAAFDRVRELLQKIPFYVNVLDTEDPRWKGLGEVMAAVILSEVDIVRAENVSKLWRYAGLAPVAAWRCKECNRLVTRAADGGWTHAVKKKNEKACDVVVRGEVDLYDSGSRERSIKGEKRHYNLFLKTKLLGVMAPCLLKASNPVWRPVYDGYKHRMETSGKGTSPGHRNNSSLRYMVKMLLIDLWKAWRESEGLPVRPPYHEEKLGIVHSRPTAPEASHPAA